MSEAATEWSPSLASVAGAPHYSRPMIPAPTRFRRSLAALAALSMLLAPLSQMAHAQAMIHEAADSCAHPSMHHHMTPASAPHGSRHQHGANCCDLCPAGCQTLALPPAMAGLSAIIASHIFQAATSRRNFVPRRAQHLLPFSLAPPFASV